MIRKVLFRSWTYDSERKIAEIDVFSVMHLNLCTLMTVDADEGEKLPRNHHLRCHETREGLACGRFWSTQITWRTEDDLLQKSGNISSHDSGRGDESPILRTCVWCVICCPILCNNPNSFAPFGNMKKNQINMEKQAAHYTMGLHRMASSKEKS